MPKQLKVKYQKEYTPEELAYILNLFLRMKRINHILSKEK